MLWERGERCCEETISFLTTSGGVVRVTVAGERGQLEGEAVTVLKGALAAAASFY
uniref:hypothetical protein n=2 Tax=unclassified Geobacillus TaxID=2642459 RepID=UPI000AADC989